MAALPYMKFFVGDYFADTRHLSCLQHGAYLQLLFAYWSRGGPLPNDDAFLARTCGLGKLQWLKMKPVILAFFDSNPHSIVHKRLEVELHNAASKSLNNKRPGNANAKRTRAERPHSHSHSHSDDVLSSASLQKEHTTPADADVGLFDFEEEPPDETELAGQYTVPFETWWREYPNKVGKGKAASAYAAAFKKLGGERAGAARVHSRLRGALLAQKVIWKAKGIVGQYIPHPATWLNQSRFDDEAVVARMRRSAGQQETVSAAPDRQYIRPPDPKPGKREQREPRRVGWTPGDSDERDG